MSQNADSFTVILVQVHKDIGTINNDGTIIFLKKTLNMAPLPPYFLSLVHGASETGPAPISMETNTGPEGGAGPHA